MKTLALFLLIAVTVAQMCAAAAESNVVHIALVFDDGPFPEHAPKLLELFGKEKIHVTFSLVATNVMVHPETAKAITAAGQEIANHSYSHLHPKQCDDATLEHEVVEAQKIIAAQSGFTPKWYWCPFLESDPRLPAIAAKAHLEVYSLKQVVVSQDYDRSVGAEEIKRKATTNVKDGSVILFHEWRDETLEQLPAILAEFRKQGCVLLNFSELATYVSTNKRSGP
jgi:peptidoglycan/xylan/chitin deacetylase (PgdA/CDA1 family)